MSKYHPDDVASYRNFIVTKKIGIAMKQLFKGYDASMDDKDYIKYQLLKNHTTYDLKDMNIVEFKKEVKKIVGA